MTHATPRPWKVENRSVTELRGTQHENYGITTDGGERIALLGRNQKANAALIIHAVNTLDEAKAALTHVLCDMEFHGLTSELGYRMSKAVLAKLEGGAR